MTSEVLPSGRAEANVGISAGDGAAARRTSGGPAARRTTPVGDFPSLALVPKHDQSAGPQTRKDFTSDQEVRWCPGCGDYAVLAAVQGFLPELGVRRENLVFVSGIGCSSRFPYYLNTYGLHSIHGRAPAIATGLSSSRPDLSVWVITGDGDALSIGGNHLIHALRRNVNLKILLFNNRIYGLTKGQYSPTSEVGKITKSTPMGSLDAPFNPVSLAIGAEATFVARTIDSDRQHLTSVLRAAAAHEGTALVEIYQNCNIFNDGAFEVLKDPQVRDNYLVRLEHGQPIRFGNEGQYAVTRAADGSLEVITPSAPGGGTESAENAGGGMRDATAASRPPLVHDAQSADPTLAFALSRLTESSNAHTPIGIFRDVQRPTYDRLLTEQVGQAVDAAGEGDLAALLAGSDTWSVPAPS